MTDQPTTPVRYTLREAAKRADMDPARLGKVIRAGKIDRAVAFHEGHRYVIWARPFDRYIGLAPEAPSPGSTPVTPLLRRVGRAS